MTMRTYKTVDGKTVVGYEVLTAEDIEEKRKSLLKSDDNFFNFYMYLLFGFSLLLLVASVALLAKAILMN